MLTIDPVVAGLVLLSAMIHASWNAIIKSDPDRLMSFGVVMLVSAIMGVAAAPFVSLPVAAAWPWLIASVVIHNFYYFFLLRAYAHGDLSHVYPIARGLAPLLVAMFAGRIVGEHLTTREFVGVLLVSSGIVGLALARGRPRGAEWRPLVYAVLTGVTIAGYSVVDGVGARRSGDALGYIAWLNIFEGPWVFAIAVWRRRGAAAAYLRLYWWRGAIGGTIATIGYGIAIWAASVSSMAHITALRETSSLFGALIGAVILKESFGGRRLLAAAIMVTGLILMNLRFG